MRGAHLVEPRQLARGERDRLLPSTSLRQQRRHVGKRRHAPSPAPRAARRSRTSSRRARAPVRCASRSVWPSHGQPGQPQRFLVHGRRRDRRPRRRAAHRRRRPHDRVVRRTARVRRQHAGLEPSHPVARRTGPARTRASTRGSAAALRAISGPMPAGSPSVIAMREFQRLSSTAAGYRCCRSRPCRIRTGCRSRLRCRSRRAARPLAFGSS